MEVEPLTGPYNKTPHSTTLWRLVLGVIFVSAIMSLVVVFLLYTQTPFSKEYVIVPKKAWESNGAKYCDVAIIGAGIGVCNFISFFLSYLFIYLFLFVGSVDRT